MCYKEIPGQILKWLDKIGGPAGNIVDIFELLAVIVTVIIFLCAMIIPLVRPVRKFLGKYGLTFGEAFIVFWKCQSNRYLYLRFYIESAIFATGGKRMGKDEWRKLRGTFLERLDNFKKADEKSAKFLIQVDSVSEMISEHTKAMIAEYFSFLAGEKKLKSFWPKANVGDGLLRKDAFCSVVSVRGGYLAPLARIAGINERYEENWKDIMDTFALTSDRSLLSQSVFSYTYTWLMWGPSIQTARLDQKEADVLGIYGFSDEAQSLFVSIPRKHFESHFNDGVICTSCEISGHIVNPISYVSSHPASFSDDSYPFLDRIKQHYRDNNDYILDVDDMGEDSSCDHYFTAYIWAMFLAEDSKKMKTGERPVLKFSDTVVFFEHTNLSGRNKASLQNVYGILADKFYKEFSNTEGINYHFVAAVNEDTREALQNKLETLKGKVSFDYSYSMKDLLDSIDSHFIGTETWAILPPESYGDLVPLCQETYGDESGEILAELFAALTDKDIVVVAIRNQSGALDAAGIATKQGDKYKVTKSIRRPDSVIQDSEIMGFSDREIKDLRNTSSSKLST